MGKDLIITLLSSAFVCLAFNPLKASCLVFLSLAVISVLFLFLTNEQVFFQYHSAVMSSYMAILRYCKYTWSKIEKGETIQFWKSWALFSKDAFNWIKVTVKDLYFKINPIKLLFIEECWKSMFFINKTISSATFNLFSTLTILRHFYDQHIRLISEGYCDMKTGIVILKKESYYFIFLFFWIFLLQFSFCLSFSLNISVCGI